MFENSSFIYLMNSVLKFLLFIINNSYKIYLNDFRIIIKYHFFQIPKCIVTIISPLKNQISKQVTLRNILRIYYLENYK
jgi:ABC-type uncharacterized transport system permease subunit